MPLTYYPALSRNRPPKGIVITAEDADPITIELAYDPSPITMPVLDRLFETLGVDAKLG